LIEGNVTFSTRRDVTFTASYIIVRNNGSLTAGSATSPHNKKLDILLTGNRNSTNIIITSKLNIGAKVLAAIDGGSVGLWGQPVGARWSKLAATAEPGRKKLLLSLLAHGACGDIFSSANASLCTADEVRRESLCILFLSPICSQLAILWLCNKLHAALPCVSHASILPCSLARQLSMEGVNG
jgi:hypothetical protein